MFVIDECAQNYNGVTLSVFLCENVPDVGNGVQPTLMKFAAEVGPDEVFRKPFWFFFLTVALNVSRGVGVVLMGGPPLGPLIMKTLVFDLVGLDDN